MKAICSQSTVLDNKDILFKDVHQPHTILHLLAELTAHLQLSTFKGISWVLFDKKALINSKKLHSTVALSAVCLRRDGVTLNFDLLTPKSNQFISVRRCTSDENWRKFVNRYWRYRGNIKLPRESRTDGQRHGRTTRKHIASAGAYRQQRLKSKRYSQPHN